MNATTRKATLRTAFRALSAEHFRNLHAWCQAGKPIGAGDEVEYEGAHPTWSIFFLRDGVP